MIVILKIENIKTDPNEIKENEADMVLGGWLYREEWERNVKGLRNFCDIAWNGMDHDFIPIEQLFQCYCLRTNCG